MEIPGKVYLTVNHRLRCIQAAALCALLLAAIAPQALWAQNVERCSIRGQVLDGKTGEGIAKALVSIRQQSLTAITAPDGSFAFDRVAPGEVEFYVSTVGYELVKKKINIAAGEQLDVTFQLNPPLGTRKDEIKVTAEPFEPFQTSVISEHQLTTTEMNSLASVLLEDPFRSLQSLPGVATSNDANAEFSVRGFGFDNIGVYLDGMLLSSPFHMVGDLYQTASLTLIDTGAISSLELLSGGFPARYGERSGSIVDIRTREGNREKNVSHVSVGMAGVSASSEGPVGHGGKATWLASGRKSYLGYLLDHINESSLAIGFQDLEAKLTWQANSKHQFILNSLYGYSWFEPSKDTAQNSHIKKADQESETLMGTWNWALRNAVLLRTQAAFGLGHGTHHDVDGTTPFTSDTHESTAQQELSAEMGRKHLLQAGWTVRSLEESLNSSYTDVKYPDFSATAKYDQTAQYTSAFAQDSWLLTGRLTFVAGIRYEHFTATGQDLIMPRAGAAWNISSRDKVGVAWGQYGQFPAYRQLWGEVNNPALRAENTTQYIVNYEHRFTEKVRGRVELYDTELHQGIYSAAEEWRLPRSTDTGYTLLHGAIAPQLGPNLRNYLRGDARGIEFLLQRRSANRLSGWVSYSLGYTNEHDATENFTFVSVYDQRHTLNAFGTYRLSDSLNMSAKYRLGSNFPVPGFYSRLSNGSYTVAQQRNQVGEAAYSKLDLRMDKAVYMRKRKLSIFGELQNAFNLKNRSCPQLILLEYSPSCEDGLPILPSAGFQLDF